MVLPPLTLTGPSHLASEISLVMSPLVGSDSNTSFEFDRSSGRPGTASSTGNDDGKPVHVAVYVTMCLCHEDGVKLGNKSRHASPTCHHARTSNARDARIKLLTRCRQLVDPILLSRACNCDHLADSTPRPTPTPPPRPPEGQAQPVMQV